MSQNAFRGSSGLFVDSLLPFKVPERVVSSPRRHSSASCHVWVTLPASSLRFRPATTRYSSCPAALALHSASLQTCKDWGMKKFNYSSFSSPRPRPWKALPQGHDELHGSDGVRGAGELRVDASQLRSEHLSFALCQQTKTPFSARRVRGRG